MLLIEKVIKLLDDFHFSTFREYVKTYSIRSFYPLSLIDAIDRDFEKTQSTEYLYFAVYGEKPTEEKHYKKFFQLAHYTFKLTGYLAKNYPNYLQHNITRIHQYINDGELEKALTLSDITLEVASKIEDFSTEIKVLSFLAQKEVYTDRHTKAIDYYERIDKLLANERALNQMNLFMYHHLYSKGKANIDTVAEAEALFNQFTESDSIIVSTLARLSKCYIHYNMRSPVFYQQDTFKELIEIEDTLNKTPYLAFPYMHNIKPKLHFLKLHHLIRSLDSENVLREAEKVIEESEEELFWNSFINQPEINSIAVQVSHLMTNYYYSYRDDFAEILEQEVKDRINFLRNKCQRLLKNERFREQHTIRFINVSTLYSALLLLGDEKDIEESYTLLENLLLIYQQIPFHGYIDSIYLNLLLATFSLKHFENMEKVYRRYKKTTSTKVVNPQNDLALHGFYYLGKWIDTGREQYAKKFLQVIEQTKDKPNLNGTRKLLLDAATYFEMPLTLA